MDLKGLLRFSVRIDGFEIFRLEVQNRAVVANLEQGQFRR
jgi:hypothetical protein